MIDNHTYVAEKDVKMWMNHPSYMSWILRGNICTKLRGEYQCCLTLIRTELLICMHGHGPLGDLLGLSQFSIFDLYIYIYIYVCSRHYDDIVIDSFLYVCIHLFFLLTFVLVVGWGPVSV